MDKRVLEYEKLIVPYQLIKDLPSTEKQKTFVEKSRSIIEDIINKKDTRLLLVIGPCSVHDIKATLDYAKKLKGIMYLYPNIFFVMRVYFEKPRTLLGWKGLLQEPFLDGKYDLNSGFKIARKLLSDITDLEIPIATEIIETISIQYISDYISWSAIGARTVESPLHRYLASGLSFPVGFKNTPSGNIIPAINACEVAKHSHSFIGINLNGELCNIITSGNENTHIILRGSSNSPNYNEAKNIQEKFIMVDCSHGNSSKNHLNQIKVIQDMKEYICSGKVKGVMIESFIEEGNQEKPLVYGKSITDKCIGWEQTLSILVVLNSYLK